MNLPSAGIVIPSYNRHHYLETAVDSVLTQTHRDFKLVIVNDYCGPDGDEKRQELESLKEERSDSRIHLLHNDSTQGISKSRNRAIKMLLDMDIPYIFFLDHDDIWSSDEKLKEQVKILSSRDIGLLGTQFDIIDKVGKIIGESHNPQDHERMIQLMLVSCPILMSSLGINSAVFKQNGILDESLNGCDDWELLMRNLLNYKGVNLPEKMTQYRIFGENTSKTQWHRLIREQMVIMRRNGKRYPSYYTSLLLGYSRLLIPQKYKEVFRPLKNKLFPGSANIVFNN